MKRMLLGLLILFTSFNSPTYLDMLKSFHVRAAGVKSVLKFERKFPQIIKDEKIYLAYLQRFSVNYKQDYFNLFNKKYRHESLI